MKDSNDHEVEFLHPSKLGTNVAEGRHIARGFNRDTTGHAPGSKPGGMGVLDRQDSIKQMTKTDSP